MMWPRNPKLIFLSLVLALTGLILYYTLYSSQDDQTNVAPLPEITENEPEGMAKNVEPSVNELPKKGLIENAPFTSQAPFADWDDPRQQDGCEEASVLMAMKWLRGEGLTKQQALDEILAMSAFELEKYGEFHDTSSQDTADRLFKNYYKYDKVRVRYDIGIDDIKKELAAGNLVIVPADGRKLGNPNFTGDGPERHKLVIKGYDENRQIFITNDPGTRKGEGYQYNYQVLISAVRDYPTGYKVPIVDERKAMIVVERG